MQTGDLWISIMTHWYKVEYIVRTDVTLLRASQSHQQSLLIDCIVCSIQSESLLIDFDKGIYSVNLRGIFSKLSERENNSTDFFHSNNMRNELSFKYCGTNSIIFIGIKQERNKFHGKNCMELIRAHLMPGTVIY